MAAPDSLATFGTSVLGTELKVRFRPLADLQLQAYISGMRCFYVLVHGKLTWGEDRPGSDEDEVPAGFYSHRYVLAQTEVDAVEKAFDRVRVNLDSQTRWLRDGLAQLAMDAEELTVAPMHKLLRPENRGHTFYTADR